MALVFGKVPHPLYQNRLIPDFQNSAWDDLGQRRIRGVVWHRMVGSLQGTDGYFRRGRQSTGLTDYGVGVLAMDGAHLDGVIFQWNDPLGRRSGWASGPNREENYGDGEAFVNEFGVNAINRDQVSIEISGNYNTPLSTASKQAIAALTAYYADRASVSWELFPMWGNHGYSFVRWHNEFTGTEYKSCPGGVVMNATPELIEMTRAILKKYQEVGAPTPTPVPDPDWDFPEGMDLGIAQWLWGDVEPFGLNPSVAGLWLEDGLAGDYYPRLAEVKQFDTRRYWRFANGLVIWRPNDTARVKVM